MSEQTFRYLNKAVPRTEDYRLLTGYGRYLDDIEIAGALHVCFVRSPHAHARIVSVDTAAAAGMPGVVTVVTGRELAQWTTPMRVAAPVEGLLPVEFATMPTDIVRFQGDLVACVVATDRYLAEDAAEQVMVEFEPLPVVTDMWQALEADAAQVDPGVPGNLVSYQTYSNGDPQGVAQRAYRVVETTFQQQRQTHVPIETRGCAAVWDAGRDHLTFHIGTQVPHPLRTQLAQRLRLSESQVTVISPDVGGSFGQKIALYREELTVAALARHLKRPVRWREDRLENLTAAANSREDFCRTRASVDEHGTLLALDLEIREDFGAYCFFPANYLARVVAMVLSGPYRLQHYAFDVKVVLSHKCGNAPMRAPMSITSWVMDGTLEAIARELKLDPVDVRRRNLLTPEELPYRTATGELLADITPSQTFEAVLAAFDYDAFRARQQAARAAGRYLGLGMCNVVEPTTYGSRFYKSAGIPGSGHEASWIRIEPSGVVNASVGLGPSGQGYESAMANAVAEGLGVDPSSVRIHLGHTDIAPYGMGSRGARSGTAGGGALYLCALDARRKVLAIAAGFLDLPDGDALRLVDARVECRSGDAWVDTGLTLADVARRAYMDPTSLPQGLTPGLEFHLTYDPPPMTYSNSTHGCEIELDVATGAIHFARYVIAEDCGTLLNPTVVTGQQHGAVAMGLSGALFEHTRYDETGQNVTGSLADYLIATSTELPNFEIIPLHTPSRATAAGIKGMAEGGVMGALGALTNAVNDALAPFGVVADRHPLTPMLLRDLLRDKL
ncbi:xanthine dehydrogenase family protein molybdopterin-binding subunit [Paraburkholderia panacisoli]|uniref:Xanthine dehydrogenase family protein molybdopterin-binding subunit n=1 Tax=Paraburkholderia panacisoli TaxID=2603818 RepID=A0A5B0HGA5_9BURK|nr:xanthine dehydrogenase family protein molybdopterin-binding subunit [Paraburkholderia panacisoli]KAA1014356.1 xanthine dehydrogenase family protein molybdopterin-binding subunit [Paraburkholderia panacisoli]